MRERAPRRVRADIRLFYGCSYRFHLSGDNSRDRYIKALDRVRERVDQGAHQLRPKYRHARSDPCPRMSKPPPPPPPHCIVRSATAPRRGETPTIAREEKIIGHFSLDYALTPTHCSVFSQNNSPRILRRLRYFGVSPRMMPPPMMLPQAVRACGSARACCNPRVSVEQIHATRWLAQRHQGNHRPAK